MILPWFVYRRRWILWDFDNLGGLSPDVDGRVPPGSMRVVLDAMGDLDSWSFLDEPFEEEPGQTFHDDEEVAAVGAAQRLLLGIMPTGWTPEEVDRHPGWPEAIRACAAAAARMRANDERWPPPEFQEAPEGYWTC